MGKEFWRDDGGFIVGMWTVCVIVAVDRHCDVRD